MRVALPFAHAYSEPSTPQRPHEGGVAGACWRTRMARQPSPHVDGMYKRTQT